jgi:hypothetical protein
LVSYEPKKIKAEKYNTLYDAMTTESQRAADTVGRRIVLPLSFKGCPRNLYEHIQDAIAIGSRYGKPDLFITMTANPNWKELEHEFEHGQKNHDRAD